jgi:thiol-disulfide isomerase/thioredoxin
MRASHRRVAPGLALLAVLVCGAVLAGLAVSRLRPTSPPPATGAPSEALALTVFDPPRPVPAIRFTDADGRARTLADFRGRVVLLDIWATWCGPCRKEMPSLDRLARSLGRADFVVLPVSIDRDGREVVEPFYRALGIDRLAIYLDPLGRGTSALSIPGVPITLLIDRRGRMVARKMGGAEWDGAQTVALIRSHLPSGAATLEPR